MKLECVCYEIRSLTKIFKYQYIIALNKLFLSHDCLGWPNNVPAFVRINLVSCFAVRCASWLFDALHTIAILIARLSLLCTERLSCTTSSKAITKLTRTKAGKSLLMLMRKVNDMVFASQHSVQSAAV